MLWNEDRYKGLSRKEREREFRRQTILAAAMEALIESSYSELTMNQIAAKAELSAASLYLFFPNKRCLLAEMLLQVFEGFLTSLGERIAELPNWEDKLRYAFENHLAFGSNDHADFLRMLNDVFYSTDSDVAPAMTERFASCQRQLLAGLQTILEQAKADDGLDIDPQFMALAIIGSMNAMHHYAALGMNERSHREMADEAIRMLRRS
jgi:AcrR family transcriptional regulator